MLTIPCTKMLPNFQYESYSQINDIAFLWDDFLPPCHHLKSDNLAILERTQPDDIDFRYLLVRDTYGIAGVLYLQEIKFSAKHYDTSVFNTECLFLKMVSSCVTSKTADLLICGNLFLNNFTGFYFDERLAPESIGQILNDYAELRKPEKKFAGICVKDVKNPLQLDAIQGMCLKAFPDDITMEMPIANKWQNMDDYANSLSRKYRQRFKKTQSSAHKLLRQELSLTEIEQYSSQIFRLYLQVVEQQPIRIGMLNARYFIEMKRSLGDDFKVVGYFENETLVGFASYIFDVNQTFEIHYIGFDYVQNQTYQIYLNILFDGLAIGIATQQKTMALGRTALLAKASLGAKPLMLHNYYAMRFGVPSLIFSALQYFFGNKMGDDWKDRNPFKHVTISEEQHIQPVYS
jgi:hypothetical protein